ncbi:hypothetical protein N2603_37830 [Bradyrhizobium huanghuaihaiense]|uniref:hypothetical protein n=1 Tax=Bradyrhizobium huanghuaihaiense TaxID=990078 RepID=UPI0021A9DCB7|nr:hypothetical protein [Bradyrhizobium sp. CB3035]UWU75698.1 hypothetical protein N2603_37830 [Bradyrhizobium sp. CB3035]
MVIAVITVGMVQMLGDEIVDMIAMRNRVMAAAESVDVSSITSGASDGLARNDRGCCRLPRSAAMAVIPVQYVTQ